MNEEKVAAPGNRVQEITFPWFTAVGSLALVGWVLLVFSPELAAFYGLPEHWPAERIVWPLAGLIMLLVLLDLRRYRRQRLRQQADLQRLRKQIDELWQSRKQLQRKAHTYSGHADKLKLFISDRLLEYIEYDEKFLHFKSIAAEVRHNGVISFDKVQGALQQAAASAERDDTAALHPGKVQEALDAMRYLWDLLDLSTADNLSLHIGNLLCECEEQYYQRMLNNEEAALLPWEPVYSPRRAAWRALALVRHEPLPEPETKQDYTLEDNHWHVRLAPADELLGTENHLVLLLENLLRNAQFFSRKRGYASPFSPVSMTLSQQQGHACFRVYNRGPHVREEDRSSLFQLGFSTRRAREHHGRGLGLYFVNEIVKGYEGRVLVHNISTPESRYAVRIELESDEIITELVDVTVQDHKPLCRGTQGEWTDAREWSFGARLRSVEVTTAGSDASETTQRLEDFGARGRESRFDPGHPERPLWRLLWQPGRNGHRLRFEPLDVTGVEFEIRLPTARQRLDNSELELDDKLDAEVERIDEDFRSRIRHDPEE